MSEAIEAIEHAAHAHSHEPHDSKKAPAMLVGLTMALMGVMIAFCAALVGGERNDLTGVMIQQTQAHSDAGDSTLRYRLVMLDLEKQRANLTPGHNAADNPAIRRFLSLYTDYAKERVLAAQYAASFDPLVAAHSEGAESYEHAQLVAEVGIVLASLAVLLGSRPPWYLSLVLAVVCLALAGKTYLHTRHEVIEGTEKVAQSQEAYTKLRKAHAAASTDTQTVEALDPGGLIRAQNATAAEAAQTLEH